MVQYSPLDGTLSALSDPTRRAILERLGQGSATISELAEPTGMSLTGLKKHVRILEDAELVTTEKKGRTRHCRLGPKTARRREPVDRRLSPQLGGALRSPGRGPRATTEREAVMTNEDQATRPAITTQNDLTIRMEREFDYPRELVWEAYTDARAAGASGWAPTARNMTVSRPTSARAAQYTLEPRARSSFWGEYREVDPPKVLESTFEFSGAPGHVSVDRLELEELDGGRTRAVAISTFDSKEDRDAAAAVGHGEGRGRGLREDGRRRSSASPTAEPDRGS